MTQPLGAPAPPRIGSLWAERPSPVYPPVSGERRTEVAVLGAGLCGLLIAALLARAGRDVLVVDRHDVGGVATRNTTAKISALQGTAYRTVTSARGSDVAARYAAAQLDAVTGLSALIAELGIDCQLTEAPAYTYGTEGESERLLREEYEAASSAGLPVQWVNETELPFSVVGAVRLDGQLHFDPEACCDGLARWLGADRGRRVGRRMSGRHRGGRRRAGRPRGGRHPGADRQPMRTGAVLCPRRSTARRGAVGHVPPV
jgi:glycine/D-amino acid oxidase-like deaminating enzyme